MSIHNFFTLFIVNFAWKDLEPVHINNALQI